MVSAEGVAPSAYWSEWERDHRAPRSHGGYGIHADGRDDVVQFAELGCTDWRVTIEWARVEPEEGRLDRDALDRYRDLLAAAHDAGLRNWLTLQHTSLPGWYLDDRGIPAVWPFKMERFTNEMAEPKLGAYELR